MFVWKTVRGNAFANKKCRKGQKMFRMFLDDPNRLAFNSDMF